MFAADATTVQLPPARVAVVNIALDVVEAIAPKLAVEVVVTSGYVEQQRPTIPLAHAGRLARDGWAADVWRTAARR